MLFERGMDCLGKKHNLPANLEKLLENYEIKRENILVTTETDMNLEGAFAKGYLILTKRKLVLVTSKPNDSEIFTFKGIQGQGDMQDRLKKDWAIEIMAVRELECLDVLRTVCGGMLYITRQKKEDGEQSEEEKIEGTDAVDRQIAAFTNRYTGDVLHFKNIFSKIKEKKEITEEDLKREETEECCPKCGTMFPDKEQKICPQCMDKRSIFIRTLKYFKPYSLKIVLMMLCYITIAGLNLIWPYLNGTILYDKVLMKNESFLTFLGVPGGKYVTALGLVVLTMVLTKIMLQIIGMIQSALTATIVPDVIKTMKTEVFRSMGKLSVSFYNSRQTGSLMTRVMGDADRVTGFFIDGLPYMLINIMTIVGTAVVMFRMNWKLALAAFILVPIIFFISWKMQPRLWSFYGKRHRAERALNAKLNDNLTGARVVKAFGQQDNEIQRFTGTNRRVKDSQLSIIAYDNRFFALYATVENIAALLVWGLGAYMILNTGEMELGLLITFTGYVAQLNGPLDFMAYVFRVWVDSLNSAQRIFEIIDAIPEIVEKKDPVHLNQIRGEIELKHLTFSYEPHKPILKNVSMKIRAGEMFGIVGRSGAGKSTLVNLISRLYDPQEGEILLDGINVKDIAFHDLRKNVSMVSQETYIFVGTVRDNIAYANSAATTEEIVQAAVLASAHDFITKMPDGYDTMIGSSGRELSGGERQRISIARAILANPKILILDEATASVDTETEKTIQASINYLVKGRTTISIAHRLSTLKDANHLVVIDQGEVVEEGTHAELLEKKGTYYKLKELQTKALAMRGLE